MMMSKILATTALAAAFGAAPATGQTGDGLSAFELAAGKPDDLSSPIRDLLILTFGRGGL
jgi:hypothetical protein